MIDKKRKKNIFNQFLIEVWLYWTMHTGSMHCSEILKPWILFYFIVKLILINVYYQYAEELKDSKPDILRSTCKTGPIKRTWWLAQPRNQTVSKRRVKSK